MPPRDVVILGAARTPIGRYGGGNFKDVHPAELGAVAVRAALRQASVEPGVVDEVLMGHGRQAGSGPNPARQVGHRAGLPVTVPAQTINKACASGLQAIAAGAQSLLIGESSVVLAGGIESMSRMPYLVDASDAPLGPQDGALRVRGRDGPGTGSRARCRGSSWARPPSPRAPVPDHPRRVRCVRAREPAEGRDAQPPAASTPRSPRWTSTERGKTSTLRVDEHPRPGSTLEGLAKLPLDVPASKDTRDHHRRLGVGYHRRRRGRGAELDRVGADARLRPLARLLGWASAGVDPRVMGIGPVPALQKLKARSGLGVDDVDLVELNEAFAAQVIAVLATCRSPRTAQRQRRRHRTRTSDRLHRDTHRRDPASRVAASRRLTGDRDAVCERRHGHGARPGGHRVTCRGLA